MAAGFERRRVDLGRQRQRDDWTDAWDGGQPRAHRAGLVRGIQFGIDFFDPSADLFDLLTKKDELCLSG
jgi:hypothetical protein